jgi:hypothetical protein
MPVATAASEVTLAATAAPPTPAAAPAPCCKKELQPLSAPSVPIAATVINERRWENIVIWRVCRWHEMRKIIASGATRLADGSASISNALNNAISLMKVSFVKS